MNALASLLMLLNSFSTASLRQRTRIRGLSLQASSAHARTRSWRYGSITVQRWVKPTVSQVIPQGAIWQYLMQRRLQGSDYASTKSGHNVRRATASRHSKDVVTAAIQCLVADVQRTGDGYRCKAAMTMHVLRSGVQELQTRGTMGAK
jgi:hypothetical protein